MIALAPYKIPLAGAGFLMKGLAHHGLGLSTPKWDITPGDLTPLGERSKVCSGPYSMMGQDGNLSGCSTSSPISHRTTRRSLATKVRWNIAKSGINPHGLHVPQRDGLKPL
jgi:hypothetical protein